MDDRSDRRGVARPVPRGEEARQLGASARAIEQRLGDIARDLVRAADVDWLSLSAEAFRADVEGLAQRVAQAALVAADVRAEVDALAVAAADADALRARVRTQAVFGVG
ncbi:MAG: hypothetical protein ACTMIR_09730 [Cellulomonadaceae bacterium]